MFHQDLKLAHVALPKHLPTEQYCCDIGRCLRYMFRAVWFRRMAVDRTPSVLLKVGYLPVLLER